MSCYSLSPFVPEITCSRRRFLRSPFVTEGERGQDGGSRDKGGHAIGRQPGGCLWKGVTGLNCNSLTRPLNKSRMRNAGGTATVPFSTGKKVESKQFSAPFRSVSTVISIVSRGTRRILPARFCSPDSWKGGGGGVRGIDKVKRVSRDRGPNGPRSIPILSLTFYATRNSWPDYRKCRMKGLDRRGITVDE